MQASRSTDYRLELPPAVQRLTQSRKPSFITGPSLFSPLDSDPELSSDQVQLLDGIIGAGFNASDYLLNVLEPRLYQEGMIR